MPLPYPVLSYRRLAKPMQRHQTLAIVRRCHRRASRLFRASTADVNLSGEFAVLLSFSPCYSHREPRPQTPFGKALVCSSLLAMAPPPPTLVPTDPATNARPTGHSRDERASPCIPPPSAHARAQMRSIARASRASRAAMRAQFSSC